MINKKLQNSLSNTVAANLISAREHRQNVALSFRMSLLGILGTPTDPIRESLIGVAVSAHTEVTVVTEQFLLGRAHKKALARLSLARGSLIRSLRALGLITGNAEPEDTAPPAPLGLSLEQVTERIIRARTPAEDEGNADVATTSA